MKFHQLIDDIDNPKLHLDSPSDRSNKRHCGKDKRIAHPAYSTRGTRKMRKVIGGNVIR